MCLVSLPIEFILPMTAFATSQIPASVNTLEKLVAWAGLALTTINPTLAANETPGSQPVNVAQTAFFRDSTGQLRLTIRASLPVAESYSTSTTKFWTNIQDLNNATIPSGYTS